MKKFIEISVIAKWLLFLAYASFAVLGAIENGERRESGYDCGKTIFTDKMVQEALEMALKTEGARPYYGPLYDKNLGYMTWPIVLDESTGKIKRKQKSHVWRDAIIQVVFDTHDNVIDLIVKLRNYEFVKCRRVGNSVSETEIPDKEGSIGYYCGQKLISNRDLEISLNFARSKLGGDYTYPELYSGHLYRKELGFRIWPIYRGEEFYRSGYKRASPYYIVIDREGGLKDVVVRVASKGKYFLRCMISKDTLPVSSSTIPNSIITKSPRTGYDCNGIYFDDNDLQTALAIAKDSHKKKIRQSYLKQYKGPPFDSSCFLWPLQPFGKGLVPGKTPPYRLVLTLGFEIMCVAMRSENILKKCERITISGGQLQENKTSYICHNTVFTHQDVILTAKTACIKLAGPRYTFPKKYTAAEFDVPGPYFIYPIIKGKNYTRCPGIHRLVLTYSCIVVGVLMREPRTGEFVKCQNTESSEKSI